MVLTAHSNVGYLNKTNTCSRVGEHHYLSKNTTFPLNNGDILNIAKIIKAVMSSGTEAELGLLYTYAFKAVKIQQNLKKWVTQPAASTNSNRQFDDRGNHNQQCPAKMYQGNGYEIPMAVRPQHQLEPFSIFLVARSNELHSLLDQAPPSLPS